MPPQMSSDEFFQNVVPVPQDQIISSQNFFANLQAVGINPEEAARRYALMDAQQKNVGIVERVFDGEKGEHKYLDYTADSKYTTTFGETAHRLTGGEYAVQAGGGTDSEALEMWLGTNGREASGFEITHGNEDAKPFTEEDYQQRYSEDLEDLQRAYGPSAKMDYESYKKWAKTYALANVYKDAGAEADDRYGQAISTLQGEEKDRFFQALLQITEGEEKERGYGSKVWQRSKRGAESISEAVGGVSGLAYEKTPIERMREDTLATAEAIRTGYDPAKGDGFFSEGPLLAVEWGVPMLGGGVAGNMARMVGLGQRASQASYWYAYSTGLINKDLEQTGMSLKERRAWAPIMAAPVAALEYIGFKGLSENPVLQEALRKGLRGQAINIAKEGGKLYLKGLARESATEMLQSVVQTAGTILAGYASDTAVVDNQEELEGMLEEFKAIATGMPFLAAPSAAIHTRNTKKIYNKAKAQYRKDSAIGELGSEDGALLGMLVAEQKKDMERDPEIVFDTIESQSKSDDVPVTDIFKEMENLVESGDTTRLAFSKIDLPDGSRLSERFENKRQRVGFMNAMQEGRSQGKTILESARKIFENREGLRKGIRDREAAEREQLAQADTARMESLEAQRLEDVQAGRAHIREQELGGQFGDERFISLAEQQRLTDQSRRGEGAKGYEEAEAGVDQEQEEIRREHRANEAAGGAIDELLVAVDDEELGKNRKQNAGQIKRDLLEMIDPSSDLDLSSRKNFKEFLDSLRKVLGNKTKSQRDSFKEFRGIAFDLDKGGRQAFLYQLNQRLNEASRSKKPSVHEGAVVQMKDGDILDVGVQQTNQSFVAYNQDGEASLISKKDVAEVIDVDQEFAEQQRDPEIPQVPDAERIKRKFTNKEMKKLLMGLGHKPHSFAHSSDIGLAKRLRAEMEADPELISKHFPQYEYRPKPFQEGATKRPPSPPAEGPSGPEAEGVPAKPVPKPSPGKKKGAYKRSETDLQRKVREQREGKRAGVDPAGEVVEGVVVAEQPANTVEGAIKEHTEGYDIEYRDGKAYEEGTDKEITAATAKQMADRIETDTDQIVGFRDALEKENSYVKLEFIMQEMQKYDTSVKENSESFRSDVKDYMDKDAGAPPLFAAVEVLKEWIDRQRKIQGDWNRLSEALLGEPVDRTLDAEDLKRTEKKGRKGTTKKSDTAEADIKPDVPPLDEGQGYSISSDGGRNANMVWNGIQGLVVFDDHVMAQDFTDGMSYIDQGDEATSERSLHPVDVSEYEGLYGGPMEGSDLLDMSSDYGGDLYEHFIKKYRVNTVGLNTNQEIHEAVLDKMTKEMGRDDAIGEITDELAYTQQILVVRFPTDRGIVDIWIHEGNLPKEIQSDEVKQAKKIGKKDTVKKKVVAKVENKVVQKGEPKKKIKKKIKKKEVEGETQESRVDPQPAPHPLGLNPNLTRPVAYTISLAGIAEDKNFLAPLLSEGAMLIPEFAFNPVFIIEEVSTYAKEQDEYHVVKHLVYRDGITVKVRASNVIKKGPLEKLSEGDLVRVDLRTFKKKPVAAYEVIRAVLKNNNLSKTTLQSKGMKVKGVSSDGKASVVVSWEDALPDAQRSSGFGKWVVKGAKGKIPYGLQEQIDGIAWETTSEKEQKEKTFVDEGYLELTEKQKESKEKLEKSTKALGERLAKTDVDPKFTSGIKITTPGVFDKSVHIAIGDKAGKLYTGKSRTWNNDIISDDKHVESISEDGSVLKIKNFGNEFRLFVGDSGFGYEFGQGIYIVRSLDPSRESGKKKYLYTVMHKNLMSSISRQQPSEKKAKRIALGLALAGYDGSKLTSDSKTDEFYGGAVKVVNFIETGEARELLDWQRKNILKNISGEAEPVVTELDWSTKGKIHTTTGPDGIVYNISTPDDKRWVVGWQDPDDEYKRGNIGKAKTLEEAKKLVLNVVELNIEESGSKKGLTKLDILVRSTKKEPGDSNEQLGFTPNIMNNPSMKKLVEFFQKSKGLSKTRAIAKTIYTKLFTSGGVGSKQLIRSYEIGQGYAEEKLSEAFELVSDWEKAVKEVFDVKEIKELSDRQREMLARGSKDPIAAAKLPQEIRKPMEKIRDMIDDLSREYMEKNLISDGLEIVFDENLGSYVARRYAMWEDPDHYDKIMRTEDGRKILDKAIDSLVSDDLNHQYEEGLKSKIKEVYKRKTNEEIELIRGQLPTAAAELDMHRDSQKSLERYRRALKKWIASEEERTGIKAPKGYEKAAIYKAKANFVTEMYGEDIKESLVPMPRDRAQAQVQEIISPQRAEGAVSSSGTSRMVRDNLIARKSIDNTFRELLGEIKNPGKNLLSTIKAQVHALSRAKYHQEVLQFIKTMQGQGEWIAVHDNDIVDDSTVPPDRLKEMSHTFGPEFTVLEGYRTDEETYRVITTMFSRRKSGYRTWLGNQMQPEAETIMAAVMKLAVFAKMAKTVNSTLGMVRNFLEAAIRALFQGHLNTGRWRLAVGMSLAYRENGNKLAQYLLNPLQAIVTSMTKEEIEYDVKERLKQWVRYGIEIQGAEIQEIEKDLVDNWDMTPHDFALDALSDHGVYKQFLRGTNKAGDFLLNNKVQRVSRANYARSDVLFKLMGCESELRMLIAREYELGNIDDNVESAISEKLMEDLMREAVDRINNVTTTRARSYGFSQAASSLPLIASFPTFFAEKIRNAVETAKLIRKDLKSPSKTMRHFAIVKSLGMAAGVGVMYGVAQAVSRYHFDDDELDELQQLVPDFHKNNVLMWFKHGDKVGYIDMSNTISDLWFWQPINAFVRADAEDNAYFNFIQELTLPFAEEDLFFTRVLDVMRPGQSMPYGTFNKMDAWHKRQMAKFAHMTYGHDFRGPLVPAHFDHFMRFVDATTGRTDNFGRKRNLLFESLSTFSGARWHMMEGDVALKFKSIDFRNTMASIRQPLLMVAKDDKSSVSDMESALSDFRKRRENFYSQAKEAIRGSINLGLTKSQARKLLSEAGISNADINHMIRGEPRPYLPQGTTKKEILRTQNGKEKLKLFYKK